MKIRILLAAVLLMSIGACTQKMCPTYAKKDVKQEVRQVEEARI